jgi:hypothetical protein
MGYGIKFLIIQSPLLKNVLKGEEDRLGYAESVKQNCYDIDDVSDDLFRLSGWTIDFIGSCKTLFQIHTDEDGDFWDNIYVWRSNIRQMENWAGVKTILEPLIDEFVSNLDYKLNDEEREQIFYTFERLFSIVDTAHTFQIC